MYKHIIYEKSDRIAWITLNRSERMNALNSAMLSEWKEALLEAGRDPEVGVIVVTGTGRSYCTGLDLKELEGKEFKGGAVGAAYDDSGNAVIDALQSVPKVAIAMVNGPCINGGLGRLLGFDLVVASEEATFGDTPTRWGDPTELGDEPASPEDHRLDESEGTFIHGRDLHGVGGAGNGARQPRRPTGSAAVGSRVSRPTLSFGTAWRPSRPASIYTIAG